MRIKLNSKLMKSDTVNCKSRPRPNGQRGGNQSDYYVKTLEDPTKNRKGF